MKEPRMIGRDEDGPCYEPTRSETLVALFIGAATLAAWCVGGYFLWRAICQ